MNKIHFLIITIFLSFFSVQSQNKLNDFGYILIPKQLSFQREPNEYNINQVLKTSLNKYNFTAFTSGENIPDDIDPCDILHLEAEKKGFLSVTMNLTFSDCYGKVIYTSIEGKSRIKEFGPSYYEAIGLTLKDPNINKHQYIPSKKTPKKAPIAITPPTVKKPIIPAHIEPKETLETIVLKLRGQTYQLVQKEINLYQVYKNDELIGKLLKQEDNKYQMKAGNLSGAGTFDDFGNFILTRVNPANQAIITDTMARVN
ncbi:hypothetical protein [Wenyingzhuangia sp. 2_MG-2023]|uniref:hypothetical protein n=1 Tax=Wenyingzhuangia sp. 2_MG-2023 TaxID=3062639 RepID=UPI0026E3EDFC|nr:hypothetical protein [Wenyingzhuangia sp. 2_MG-2023]MDO6738110.1 hypothetical protein [Wenyingzhuangia sp. 2_MG-2023]